MAAILGMLVLNLLLQLLLLAVAAVIGFVLHWCFPAMNIGTGILIGMLSSIASAYFLAQLMRIASESGVDLFDEADENDEDEQPEICFALPPIAKPRRRRRSKKD
jgi:hypothetical protein